MRLFLDQEDFPKTLKIVDSDYHLIFVDKVTKKDLAGQIWFDSKIIFISRNQTLDEVLPTFWHECLHAIEKEVGLELGHPAIEKIERVIAQIHSQFYLKQK